MSNSINLLDTSKAPQGIIDSHAHFWDLKRLDYPWLEHVPDIQKTFLPTDYHRHSYTVPLEKIVFVQSDCRPDQGLAEVDFVTELADLDPKIQAIVAYCPIDQPELALAEIVQLQKNSLVRGVRCMFNDASRFLSSGSIDILRTLPDYQYSFDVCIKFKELNSILRMIEQCPDTQFIIDHLAKPDIQNDAFQRYKDGIDKIAEFPNVYAKISGLITEAGSDWTANSISPYIQYAIEKLGCRRLMFGSNWPVVLLNGSFITWYQLVEDLMTNYTIEDRNQLFYFTAANCYHL